LGLSVMVRPLIDFLNPAESAPYSVGEWRQDYEPTNVAAFFASYQQMIVAEAQVAQQNGAQMLSIGAELDQLAGPQYLTYWTDIIASVRAVFGGALTYSASWNTANQVSFWSELDYEGIDCYIPLSDAAGDAVHESRRIRRHRQPVADAIFRDSRGAVRQAAHLHRARLSERQRCC